MILNLIFIYSRLFFILPVPAFCLCDLGGVAGALASKDQGKMVIEYLSLFCVSVNQVSRMCEPSEKKLQLLLHCSGSSTNTICFCSLFIWRHWTFAKGVTFWCWYGHYSSSQYFHTISLLKLTKRSFCLPCLYYQLTLFIITI